jgi:hypothetical protein
LGQAPPPRAFRPALHYGRPVATIGRTIITSHPGHPVT